MKKHLLLSLAFVLSTIISLAAPSSLPDNIPSTGRDFWLTFMHNNDVDNNYLKLRIYAVAQSATNVTITKANGTVLTSGAVAAGSVFSYTIPDAERSNVYMTSSGRIEAKGLHVTSDASDIALYVANNFDNGSKLSFDATPVIATSALGKEYVVQTYYADKTAEEMVIVGTEDGTNVTIVLGHEAINDLGANFSAGQTISISLNAGQAYQLKGNVDGLGLSYLSGTTVLSTKPVAVFNGGINTTVTYDDGADGDHIVEQSIPISAWGKRFIVSPMHGFPSGANVSSSEPTQFSVTAIYDGTEVKVNGVTLCTLNRGETNYEFNGYGITVNYNEAPKFIETSMPVICYGYTTNGTSNKIKVGILNRNVGEPSMVLIPDKRQGVQTSLFTTYNDGFSGDGIAHYANILVPDTAVSAMKLNGTDISSSFTALSNHFSNESGSWNWMYARVALSNGFNVVSNSKGTFLAYAYGVQVGSARGYAMATNFNLAPAAPEVFIGGERMNHNDVIDFCNRHPGMSFSANVDYVHDSIRWDYGDGNTSSSINSNHIYNILVNGQSQTNIVKFFVFRHDPLSGDKHTDTVKVTLNVHPTYYDTLEVDLCGSEESYHWTQSSENFNNEGIHKVFLAGNDALGVSATGHEYHFDANTETEYFDSIVYRTSTWDCDSIFFLRLRVHKSYDVVESATSLTVCQNEPFEWTNHPLNDPLNHKVYRILGSDKVKLTGMTAYPTAEPATYTLLDSMTTARGCDSVITRQWIVYPEYSMPTVNDEVCQNEPYVWKDGSDGLVHKLYRVTAPSGYITTIPTDVVTTLTIIDSMKTINSGCDSIETLVLVIHPEFNSVVEPGDAFEVCQNEPFAAWPGHPLSGKVYMNDVRVTTTFSTATAGTFTLTDSLTTIHGCDSVVTRTLIIHPEFNTVVEAGGDFEVCQNEPFAAWPGHPLSGKVYMNGVRVTTAFSTATAGTFTLMDSLTTVHGCDSVVTRTLIIHPVYAFDESYQLCANDLPYIWHGKSLMASGNYTNDNEDQTTIYGCDSIYTLHLTVYPKPTINIVSPAVSMCQGTAFLDPYAIHFTSSNTTIVRGYVWNSANVVVHSGSIIASPTAFSNAFFSFASSMAFLPAGNYRIRLVAYNEEYGHSCPSDTASVGFVIHPKFYNLEKDTICDTAEPISWHGKTLNFRPVVEPLGYDTVYYDSLTSVQGCDSVYELRVRVERSAPLVTTATICYGESYDWVITHPCTGADYKLMKNLTSSCEIYDTIRCPGAACNKVFKLELTVRSKQAAVVDAPRRICKGETFTWRGLDISAPGVYETLDNTDLDANGCARTHRITVTQLEPQVRETAATICYGEPYTFGSHTYAHLDAGLHILRDTIASKVGGCDSVYVVLRLTVGQQYLVEESHTACDAYQWRGKTLTVSGDYADTLASVNGCDSVYLLHLTVNKSYSFSETYAVALQEMPFTVHEFTYDYSSAGTYNDTRAYQTVAGCDSLYHITLNVYDAPVILKRDTTLRTICKGGTCSWRGGTYTEPGDYSVADADSVHLLRLTVNDTYRDTLYIHTCATGYYFDGANRTVSGTYVYNGTGVHGCDSVVVLKLTVAAPSPVTNINATACRGDLFAWGGEAFVATTNRTLRDTLLNVAGCDSVVVLTLTVNNYAVGTTDNVSICDGDSYLWPSNGKTYSAPGTYLDTVAGGGSCGTVNTLNLNVNPSYHFFDDVELRQEVLPYTWRGHTFHFESVYDYDITDDYTTIHGCDSVYHLHLHIVPEPPEENDFVYRDTTAVDACMTYNWHGHTYTEDGLYSDTVWKAGRYDTVHFINLTIHPVYEFVEDDIISCDNEIITWHCTNYNPASGYYAVTTTETSVHGCDSVFHANFRVYKTFRDTTSATMCQYDVFTWRGMTLSPAAGTYLYSDTLASLVSGCDSIYFLSLTVTPRTLSDTTEYTMCNLASYDWQGYHIANKEAGDYEYYKYYTPDGECETFHYLLLHVYDVVPDTTHASVCYGESYDWWVDSDGNGSLDRHVQNGIYVPGYQYDTVPDGACNKVFVLDLSVMPAPDVKPQDEGVMCPGGNYLWRGHTYTAAGVYGDTVRSLVTGCDSLIFSLNLTEQKATVYQETVHRCYGETYTWPLNGTTYTASASDMFVVPSLVTGCDSIVYNLSLLIDAAPLAGEESVVLCADSYTWHGSVLTASGDYVETLTSSLGCDSTATLHLTLSHDETFYETVAILDTQLPYTWHEDTYTGGGTYTQHHQNIFGCDSDYVLTLIVSPKPMRTENKTICEGETYSWRGNTYTAENSYHVETADSIHILNLKVGKHYNFAEEKHICSSDLPYSWQGQSLASAGTHTAPYTTYCGCDSVYTLTLYVAPVAATAAEMTLCEGEVFNWGPYFEKPAAGTYSRTATFPSLVSGCDSTVNLTLHVVGPTTVNALETQNVCKSELPYSWRGHTYSAAGLYGDTVPSLVTGCDSVLSSLHLIVNEGFYEYNDVEINEDAVPYYWNGHNMLVSEEGSYFDTYADMNGCDSVYELHLHLNFYKRDTTWADGTHGSSEACDSYSWRGRTFTASGIYTDTVKSANPVEIYYLSLVVNESVYAAAETVETCGSEYMWHGINRPSSGTYTYTASGVAANGCDSVYTLHLTLYPEYNIAEPAITICDNEYVHWHDTLLHTAGTYTRRYTSVRGCDSLRTVTVNVNPTYGFVEKDTICEGESLTWHGLTLANIAPSNTPYTYYDTHTSASGCDSVYELQLLVRAPRVFHDTVYASACEGSVYGWEGNNGVFVMNVHVTESMTHERQFGDLYCVDSTYTLIMTMLPVMRDTVEAAICGDDTYSWAGKFLSGGGTYYDTLTAVNGCDSVRVLILHADPAPEDRHVDYTGCPGTEFNYNVIAGHPFVYTTPGVYHDTVRSIHGCDSIWLTVNFEYSAITTHVLDEFVRESDLPYYVGVESFSAPNTYNFTVPNFQGCAEPYTLSLHVLADRYDTLRVHVCAGEGKVVDFYGTDSLVYPTPAGVMLQDTLITADPMAYDTVRHLVVMAENVSFSGDTTIYALVGSPAYLWPGHTLTKVGETTPVPAALTTVAGLTDYYHRINCDSIYYLHFNVIDTPSHVDVDTVCPSALPYEWVGHAGKSVPAGSAEDTEHILSDITTVSFGTPEVFDSYDTLYLYVKPTYSITLPDTVVLQNEPLLFCGTPVSTSEPRTELLTRTLTSSIGCDSVVSRNLKVVKYVPTTAVVCDGDDYTWLTYSYDHSVDTTVIFPVGSPVLSVLTDSVCRLQLTVETPDVKPVFNGNCNKNALPYVWRGHNYTESGIYRDTVLSANGCAAEVYTLDLVVGPLVETKDTICDGETMMWGGVSVTAPSSNNDFVRNDTTFRLNLYAAPHYSFTLDTTIYIGAGRPAVFNWLNENGATIRSIPTADATNDKFFGKVDSIYETKQFGCDSVYHLTLRIYGDTTITEKDTICADQVLSWHCKTFDGADKAGQNFVLYDSLTTWYGADSVHVLNLHVGDSCMPKPAMPLDTVICYGQTFDWVVNGNLVSTYNISAVDVFVDDSVYTLNLTVNGDYSEIIDAPDTIVYGETFTWHGDDYAGLAEGDHLLQKEFTTYRGGCDSIYKINLYVKPLNVEYVDSVAYDTICAGDYYDWYISGEMVQPDGYHVSTTSTLFTQKTVNNVPPVADTVYRYTMHLTVRDVELRNEYQQIPCGGSYVWAGHYGDILLSSDTVISDTVRYTVGMACDSVIYRLTLSMLPPATFSTIDTVFCQNDKPVMWGSEVIPVNNLGTFSATLRTTNHLMGDSIITLNYTVVPAASFDSVHVISPLDGNVYTWNEHTYHANMDTTFRFNSESAAGCDSVATLRVMTGLLAHDTAYAAVCPTETTYHWTRGTLDTTFVDVETGLYYGIKPTFTPGFDSVIVLSLTKLQTDTLHLFDTTCYDPLVDVKPADTLYLPFAAYACDSVVKVTHHHVITQLHENVVDTVIQGSNFIWGSVAITGIQPQNVGAGNPDYVFTNEPFTSVFGCDSTVTMWLYVAPKYEFFDTVRICLGDSYTWTLTGQTFTPEIAGYKTYKRVYKSEVYGNDSIYNLTLFAEEKYSNIRTVAIDADSVLQWRGRSLDTTGYYYDSLTSVSGCDSVYGLHLYVGRIAHDTVRATICDGDIFSWTIEPGVTQQETTAGFHYYSWHQAGPPAYDSILVLDLTVNPSYDYTAELHVPQDSTFVWEEDGQTYDTHNAGMQLLTNALNTTLGCDSVLNLNLYVEPTYFIQQYDTVCEIEGMSLLAFDSVRTEYGVTTYGFDSIVQYNLFVHGTPVVYEYDSLCHSGDDVVMWHGMNIAALNPIGGDTVVYATEQFRPGVYDCDTLYTLYLHIYPDYLFTFRDTIPDSEVYGTRWRDTLGVPELDSIPQLDPQQTPQVFYFYDTLQTVHGCDSVYALELLVGPTFKFEETLNTCDNDSVCWHDSIWYVMLPEGTYYDTLVYKTTLGYDSVYTLTLTVNPMRTYEWSDTICPTDQALCGSKWITYHDSLGTDYENIVIEAWDTIQTYLGCDSVCHLSLHFYMQYDSVTVDSVCYDTPFYWAAKDTTYLFHDHGVYTDSVMLQTIHGCDSILRLELYVENLWKPDTTFSICIGDTLHWLHRDTLDLFITSGDSLTWNTYPADSVGNFLFVDTVYSALGCVYYDTLHLMVVEPVVVLSAQVDDPYCADNNEMTIIYTIDTVGGEPQQYYLYFSDAAREQGFFDIEGETMAHTGTIVVQLPQFGKDKFPRPDTYEATLYLNNGSCRDTATMSSVTFTFDILYPSWFAEQHWNDYLAVLSPEGNKTEDNPAGYTFTAYQWYINGEPIDGATDPMLYYLHGIPTADMPHSDGDTTYAAGSYYQVMLTREDDGKAILTCPLIPQEIPDKDVHNDWYFTVDHTFIDHNNPNLNILTNTTGSYHLYDAAGKLLATGEVAKDDSGYTLIEEHHAYRIEAINEVLYVPGTYLLWMVSDEPSPYTGRRVRRAVKLLVY